MAEIDMKSVRTNRWQLNVIGLSAIAGLIAIFVMGVTELLLIFRDVEYNPVIDSISSLGLRSFGWVQTISFLIAGLLIEVFAIGLYLNIRHRVTSQISVGILVLFGFGLLLIAAFRTQPTGTPQTIEGVIHSFTARTIFLLFPIACFLIAPNLKADERWEPFFIYTMAAGVLAAILVIIWIAFSSRINWFGLYERLLVANATIWLGVMATQLWCLSRRIGGA